MDYSLAKLIQTIGEVEENKNEEDNDYLLSQSQHLIADNETVYVSMMLNRNIRAIDAVSGKLKYDIGEMGFSDENFVMASGMAFYGEDQIIVTDLNGNKVQLHKKDSGEYVTKIKYEFDLPACVAVSKDKNIYVGEVGSSSKKILCFNAEFHNVFSTAVAGDKDFTGVNYLAFDNINDRVIASDTDGGFVHVFSSNLQYQFSISEDDSDSSQLNSPTGVAVDKHGNILVCDMGNSVVKVYDNAGKYLSELGGNFINPYDIFIRDNGDVLVVDGEVLSGWSRVQVFRI